MRQVILEAAKAYRESATDATAPCIVTLVHGTFAPKAAWTREGSPLRAALNEALGNVTFVSHDWSGENTLEERLSEADKLADELWLQHRIFPEARRIVVGHSHGGSIAAYALQRLKPGCDVSGIICLATPFIHFQPRGDFGDIRRAIISGGRAAGACTMMLLLLFVSFGWWKNLLAVFLAGLIGDLIGHYFAGGSTNFDPLAEQMCRELNHKLDPHQRVLIIRSTGDEASGLLTMTQFFTSISTRVWRYFCSLQTVFPRPPPGAGFLRQGNANQRATFANYKRRWVMGRIQAKFWTKLVLVSLVVITLAFLGNLYLPQGGIAQGVVQCIGMAAALFAIVGLLGVIVLRTTVFDDELRGLALICSAVSLACSNILFGTIFRVSRIGSVFLSLFVDAVAESTPSGAWTVHQLPFTSSKGEGFSLSQAHSFVYEHPDALTLIADCAAKWLQADTANVIADKGCRKQIIDSSDAQLRGSPT